MPPIVTYSKVQTSDFEELADMRVAAMRESLERVGRFDAQRARERLRSTFVPERTRFILVEGEKVGFYATRDTEEGMWLDHLYVLPAYQGRGIGGVVLQSVFSAAAERCVSVRVGALKESASNRFYQRHGFTFASEGEWDSYYVRLAAVADETGN